MLDRYLRAAPPPSRVTWFMIWRMYKDGGAKACFDTYFFFRQTVAEDFEPGGAGGGKGLMKNWGLLLSAIITVDIVVLVSWAVTTKELPPWSPLGNLARTLKR